MHISTYTSTTIRKKIIDIPIVGPTTLHRQGFWSVPHWKQIGKMGINGASHILVCLIQLIYNIYYMYGEVVLRSSWRREIGWFELKLQLWRLEMMTSIDGRFTAGKSPDDWWCFFWPIMGRDVYQVLFSTSSREDILYQHQLCSSRKLEAWVFNGMSCMVMGVVDD